MHITEHPAPSKVDGERLSATTERICLHAQGGLQHTSTPLFSPAMPLPSFIGGWQTSAFRPPCNIAIKCFTSLRIVLQHCTQKKNPDGPLT